MPPFSKQTVIDPVDIENGFDGEDLSDAEKRFLQDHMLLDTDQHGTVPVVFYTPDGAPVSNDPAYFASIELQNHDRFQQLVEQRATEIAKQMLLAEQHEGTVTGSEYHGNAVNEPARGTPPTPALLNPDPSALDEDDDYDALDPGEYDNPATTKDHLIAEIVRRNEQRPADEHLSISGKKEELIQRLKDDDEE